MYFETGDEAGNGKDRPPPGTQCAGGCIEGAVGNTDRWGNTYCDTVDGNWGAECLECRTLGKRTFNGSNLTVLILTYSYFRVPTARMVNQNDLSSL